MVWILLKEVLFPSSPSIVHWPINLLMSIVVVVTIANFVDFHCCPFNLHIYLHLLISAPQPLETWYHVPFWSFGFLLSYISIVEMTCAVYQHSAYLHVLMLALKTVPLSFSSSFEPLPLCFFVLFFYPWLWSSVFLNYVLPLESTPWRFCCCFSCVFQCCLHLLFGLLDLGLWILWIILLVNKQIFKNLC